MIQEKHKNLSTAITRFNLLSNSEKSFSFAARSRIGNTYLFITKLDDEYRIHKTHTKPTGNFNIIKLSKNGLWGIKKWKK